MICRRRRWSGQSVSRPFHFSPSCYSFCDFRDVSAVVDALFANSNRKLLLVGHRFVWSCRDMSVGRLETAKTTYLPSAWEERWPSTRRRRAWAARRWSAWWSSTWSKAPPSAPSAPCRGCCAPGPTRSPRPRRRWSGGRFSCSLRRLGTALLVVGYLCTYVRVA